MHPGHVPCPEQCATRVVVLEREDPAVRFWRLSKVMRACVCSRVAVHISRICLLCQLASRRTDSAVRHHDSQPYS